MDSKQYGTEELFCPYCKTFLSLCSCPDWLSRLNFLYTENLISTEVFWGVVGSQVISRQKIDVKKN